MCRTSFREHVLSRLPRSECGCVLHVDRRFLIGREKPGEQSEVAQLIQQTLEQERWQREVMEQRYNQYMDDQEVSARTLLKAVSRSDLVVIKKKEQYKNKAHVFVNSILHFQVCSGKKTSKHADIVEW